MTSSFWYDFNCVCNYPHVHPERDTFGMFGSQFFLFDGYTNVFTFSSSSPFHYFFAFRLCNKLRRYLRGNFLPTVPHPFEKGNWIPRSHIRPPQQRWSLATWASGICSPGFSTDSNLELGWNPEALKNLGLSVLDILRHIELPKIPKSERFQETNLCT